MTTYDRFPFSGTPGTTLEGYTDGLGALSQHPTTTGAAQVSGTAQEARAGTDTVSLWVVGNTLLDPSYTVLGDLLPMQPSLTGYDVRVYARLDPTIHTGYAVVLTEGGAVGLRAVHAGVMTTPGGSTLYGGDLVPTLSPGDILTVQLQATNSNQPVVSAVVMRNRGIIGVLSFTDDGSVGGSPILGSGRAGFGFNLGVTSPAVTTDAAGIHLGNFAVSLIPDGSLPPLAYRERDMDAYRGIVAAVNQNRDFDSVDFGDPAVLAQPSASNKLCCFVEPGEISVRLDENQNNKVRTVTYRVTATAPSMKSELAYRLTDRLDSVMQNALARFDAPFVDFIIPGRSFLSKASIDKGKPDLLWLEWTGQFAYRVASMSGAYEGVENY